MLTEDDIRQKCLDFIRSVQDSNKLTKQRERATLNQDFFRGGTSHWTEEEYYVYKSKGVEPVTINRCRPVVKAIVGMYLQNKQSIRVRPRKGGTVTVASVWTEIVKHAEDMATADYIYAELFMRGSIDTEAFIKLGVDKTANINGQPTLKVIPLADGDADPSCTKYDLSGFGKFFIEKEWKDKEWIETEFPDKKEAIGEGIAAFDDEDDPTGVLNYLLDEDISEDENESEDTELTKKYKYRIRRIYWKEVVPGLLVVDTERNVLKIISDEKLIKKIKKQTSDRYRFEDVPTHRLHETTMLGGLVLKDTPDPYGKDISDLPVWRFSPYWDLGYANGVLDDAIPLNREENIHRTQIIKILNQTANSGWKVGGGTDGDKKSLGNFGSVEGLVVDLSKFKGMAEKIQPNQPPTGLMINGQQFEQDIKRVSGVDDASFGYETGKSDSGKALGLKREQNNLTAGPVFNNFYHTLELYGSYLLRVLRKNSIYTDDEIKAVVAESTLLDMKMLDKAKNKLTSMLGAGLPEPMPAPEPDPAIMSIVKPEDQQAVFEQITDGIESAQMYAEAYPRLQQGWNDVIKQMAVNMLLEELKSDVIGEYGVKVTVSPSAPTERIMRRMELDVLSERYPNLIPPDLLIDATDLPNKEEIKERLLMQQQVAMQGVA